MPTFGDTSLIGSDTTTIENIIIAGYFQMGSINGQADSITTKLTVITKNHYCKCAIYDNNKNLLENGVTEEKLIPKGTTHETITFNFVGTKPNLTANAWYYICIWGENQPGDITVWYKNNEGNGLYDYNLTYNSYPDNVNFNLINNYYLLTAYCTYTETGETQYHYPVDTSKAQDTLIFKAKIPFSDLSKAQDSLNFNANIPFSDLAKAFDNFISKAKIPLSDLAKASDSVNYVILELHLPSDLAKAQDTIIFKAKIPFSDLAKAQDNLNFKSKIPFQDLVKAIDNLNFNAKIPFQDLVKASDNVNYVVLEVHLPSDTAKAQDSLIFKAEIPFQDLAKAQDNIDFNAKILFSDLAKAQDNLNFKVNIPLSDLAKSYDSFISKAKIPLSDLAKASDSINYEYALIEYYYPNDLTKAQDSLVFKAKIPFQDLAKAQDIVNYNFEVAIETPTENIIIYR